MNKRLEEIYSNIAIQNKNSFLNNDIHLDKTWGQEIWGVTLQIDLSEEVRNKLVEIQNELNLLEPDNLLLLPRQFQHISFNQVVFWDGEYSKGKKETWEEVKKEFISSFANQNNKHKSFEITFDKTIATGGGIIWCADDESDNLERLREVFLKEFPFPRETTKLNHIVHTTIARYKNKLSNPQKVFDFISNYKESATMKTSKIILRNELVFPSIKTKNFAEIRLN